MDEAPIPGIRPALETLRELDEGRFLDKLAFAIRDVTDSVRALNKPGKIAITLEIAPFTQKGLTEPVLTIESDIAAKPPKPDAPKTLFFVDDESNPTRQPQRQRGLALQIAGDNDVGATG